VRVTTSGVLGVLFFVFSECGKLIRQWWLNTGRMTSLLISPMKATENTIRPGDITARRLNSVKLGFIGDLNGF